MSTVSFPGTASHTRSHPSVQEDFFGSSYDPSSSFQMNPASPHPPRTPRTSVISNTESYVYGSDVYASSVSHQEETQEKPETAHFEEEEVAEDVEEDVDEKAVQKVKTPEVWREVLRTSSGRDKAFKIMQYTLRVYLLFHGTVGSSRMFAMRKKTNWEIELVKRMESTASSLSTTRKALIMFNWLTPLTSILSAQDDELSFSEKSPKEKETSKPLLQLFLRAPPPALLDFVNGLSDDIYAFYRLGLIGKKTGERAGRFSDWCWFFGTLIALIELGFERNITKSKIQAVESKLYSDSISGATEKSKSSASRVAEKELEKLRRQDFWLRIQRTKLLLDLLFVSYEVFKIKPLRDTVKPFAGLGAAVLSTARLFHNHRTALILKESRQ
ncbi:uncharacterized protein FOMMEDRAFT_21505 [Fomitiporia mediterranea MF3/22]|uniref:uncharacterized protein n=1 Tax=Fomitiporia mediterranea (strain MF3/22) TaxID=694068 RepID=UPI0004408062|nr:uncharacterized protein FOMMEDRAFT_21505 [Fomitiporia mediterranea MF3/22]EJD01047.1 hypothetical protein FOMMEDRAFT_21505 [Fomitiporia mediterranea MF3/22]